MRQHGLFKHNDDPEMMPFVAENKGPGVVTFTSILEEKRFDLVEYDDAKKFMILPGKRRIIPHGYFRIDFDGKCTLTYHVGTAAPELRGYNRAYRMRAIVKPWYKKISDYFSSDR